MASKDEVVCNFGIPYGRGPAAIAKQVKAETGSDASLQQLEAELTEVVHAWKEVTYPVAWAYMKKCAAAIHDPGYLVNPWGRYRRFPSMDSNYDRADLERRAQNFPELNGEVKQGEFMEYLSLLTTLACYASL